MPAVFVHGVPERAAIWDDLRGLLQRDDHIAVALPGFGVPVPEGFGCTMDEYAGWLAAGIAAVAEAQGPVDLVGHDWGGLLALRVASTRPELLRSWVSDTAALLDPQATWHAFAQIWQSPEGEGFMAGVEAAGRDEREAGAIALGVPAERAHLASLGDPVMDAAILALYRSAVDVMAAWGPDVEAAAARPGLVLHAEHDPFLDAAAAARTAQRAGARHEVLGGLGHFWCVQDPRRGAEVLERFWSPLDRGGAA